MTRKWFGMLAVLLSVLLIVSACGGSGQSQQASSGGASGPSSGDGKKTFRIGALWPTAAIAPVQSKIQATEDEGRKLGVEIITLDAQFDPQKQSQQALDLITQKVDGVLIDIIDPQAIVPSVKKLYEAGIPVIVTTLPIAEEGKDYLASFIGSDNVYSGRLAGELMKEALGEKGGNVVIIEGAASSIIVQERTAGFKEALQGSNIKILDIQSSPWDRQKAMDIMQNFLTKYSDLQGVFVEHDSMVPGVVQALRQAGRLDEVKIVGFGATYDGVDLMKEGLMYGSVTEDLDWQSREGVRKMVEILEGKQVDKVILGENRIIKPEDLSWYKATNY